MVTGRVEVRSGGEVGLRLAQGALAGDPVTEHGVGFRDVQQRQPGQHQAPFPAEFSGPARQCSAILGVKLPVEGDEALPQDSVRLGHRILDLTGHTDGLLEVLPGGRVIASLGGIPDELTHQGGGLRLGKGCVKPHVLGVLDVSAAVFLTRRSITRKTNEIGMFAEVMDQIESLEGVLVTADAMGCQTGHVTYRIGLLGDLLLAGIDASGGPTDVPETVLQAAIGSGLLRETDLGQLRAPRSAAVVAQGTPPGPGVAGQRFDVGVGGLAAADVGQIR